MLIPEGIKIAVEKQTTLKITVSDKQLVGEVASKIKTLRKIDPMAKKVSAKARAAARKQRDKWKMKRWYTIRAPRNPWEFKKIGETLGRILSYWSKFIQMESIM